MTRLAASGKPRARMGLKGEAGFHAYYSKIYGDRWPALAEALARPARQVARPNLFAVAETQIARANEFERADFAGMPGYILPEGLRFQTSSSSEGLTDFYVLDPASIFPAAALEVANGDEVLDLCAAPGGKSLILAQSLGAEGRLTCNELSPDRRGRLRGVLNGYLPKGVRDRVDVTGHDGSRWGLHKQEAFDRILLDAPCSGERHLLHDREELKLWSEARSKHLAIRQYALLASALQVVRSGGRIVYSTCSLSPLENDGVIQKLLKKRGDQVRVLKREFSIGEATEHGWAICPDRDVFGPIYFAILEKLSQPETSNS